MDWKVMMLYLNEPPLSTLSPLLVEYHLLEEKEQVHNLECREVVVEKMLLHQLGGNTL